MLDCHPVLDKRNHQKLNDSFCNSECGPEAALPMCHVVRTFSAPLERAGNSGIPVTLGALIDRTSKGQISKVMLEEKVFETGSAANRSILIDNGRLNNLSFAQVNVL